MRVSSSICSQIGYLGLTDRHIGWTAQANATDNAQPSIHDGANDKYMFLPLIHSLWGIQPSECLLAGDLLAAIVERSGYDIVMPFQINIQAEGLMSMI